MNIHDLGNVRLKIHRLESYRARLSDLENYLHEDPEDTITLTIYDTDIELSMREFKEIAPLIIKTLEDKVTAVMAELTELGVTFEDRPLPVVETEDEEDEEVEEILVGEYNDIHLESFDEERFPVVSGRTDRT